MGGSSGPEKTLWNTENTENPYYMVPAHTEPPRHSPFTPRQTPVSLFSKQNEPNGWGKLQLLARCWYPRKCSSSFWLGSLTLVSPPARTNAKPALAIYGTSTRPVSALGDIIQQGTRHTCSLPLRSIKEHPQGDVLMDRERTNTQMRKYTVYQMVASAVEEKRIRRKNTVLEAWGELLFYIRRVRTGVYNKK